MLLGWNISRAPQAPMCMYRHGVRVARAQIVICHFVEVHLHVASCLRCVGSARQCSQYCSSPHHHLSVHPVASPRLHRSAHPCPREDHHRGLCRRSLKTAKGRYRCRCTGRRSIAHLIPHALKAITPVLLPLRSLSCGKTPVHRATRLQVEEVWRLLPRTPPRRTRSSAMAISTCYAILHRQCRVAELL